MKSDDKTALWAVKSTIGWALRGHLPAMPAATLATTVTFVSEDTLASQLSSWWDIELYASNCDVSGHSKEDEQEQMNKMSWRKPETSFNGICHIILSSTRINPRKLEECATQQQIWRCGLQRQISIWTRPVAEFDQNYFSLPRTPNSAFSRHRRNVSSSCFPKRWQPMLKISGEMIHRRQ